MPLERLLVRLRSCNVAHIIAMVASLGQHACGAPAWAVSCRVSAIEDFCFGKYARGRARHTRRLPLCDSRVAAAVISAEASSRNRLSRREQPLNANLSVGIAALERRTTMLATVGEQRELQHVTSEAHAQAVGLKSPETVAIRPNSEQEMARQREVTDATLMELQQRALTKRIKTLEKRRDWHGVLAALV